MNVRHSSSLFLIWQVAEFEARQLKSSTIEPIHLLLGLSKTVDLDLPALMPKGLPGRDEVLEECLREVRRLRNAFCYANLAAATLHHHIRRISAHEMFAMNQTESLHRSPTARKIFFDAEHYALLGDGVVYPVHLLFALLTIRDCQRDQLLTELAVNKKRLQEAIRRELLNEHSNAPTWRSYKPYWN